MSGSSSIASRVLRTRRATLKLVESLGAEDLVVQSMPDASPAKWHLAHTTWFFERFVLRPLGMPPVNDAYDYLFNSYYDAVGDRMPRASRGMLTRPTVAEVFEYRRAIDARLADLEGEARITSEVTAALELGVNHEEQHQELLLTDLKHLFGENPQKPTYRPHVASEAAIATARPAEALRWIAFGGGLEEIGHRGSGFAFDNEGPRHKVHIAPFAVASRTVTCGEFLAFMNDGGYRRPELWLSDGWAWVQSGARQRPMYWTADARPNVFTLHGMQPFAEAEPVCHVTYYEADAYARWAGARLPTEPEWEVAADRGNHDASAGIHDAMTGRLHPVATASSMSSGSDASARPTNMLGSVWEWTQSAYAAYPGFRPLEGAFGEYNGKFMVNQLVLRGGSCVTPRDHVRATYRNFFPPGAAWQFSGIRLARDA